MYKSYDVRLPNDGYNSYGVLVVEDVIARFLPVKDVDRHSILPLETTIFRKTAFSFTYLKGTVKGRIDTDNALLTFL